MKLSIIIPVYNNWNFTKSCLKDLSKLPNDHEVIVIDNGSTDATYLELSEYSNVDRQKNLLYIRKNENLGFAKACNKAYKISTGEYVLFLNNDIRVNSNHENWTEDLIKEAEDGSIVGPTGGVLDALFNFISEVDRYIETKYFYISGWCMCAKRETFDKLIMDGMVGPFEEAFETYFEDTDLSLRAKKMNIKLKIVKVPVTHFGKTTSKKIGIQKLYIPAKAKFIEKWSKK
jgi:GT2 family glycosyltransferase